MTTKEKAEIMLAHAAGAEIEFKQSPFAKNWEAVKEPMWAWDILDYRIKPRDPRRIWVNECAIDKHIDAFMSSEKEAKSKACRHCTTTEFVEVIKP
jgi:hypothetical protein